MRLNANFLAHETGNGWVLVPTGGTAFSGVVRGNKTFGEILKALSSEVDEAEIACRIRERFDAPEDVVELDVARALAEHRRVGALDE